MFCAELMSNMKDVPSTERMVMCSQRWKLLKQGEKDGYQKRCEQVSSDSAIGHRKKKKIQLMKGFLKMFVPFGFVLLFFRGRRSMKLR